MAVYEALPEPGTITYNGPTNASINMVAPTPQSDPDPAIPAILQYDAGGDVDGDGTLDVGDTFLISFDGGITFVTAEVTYNFSPNASSDSDLMVFVVDTNGDGILDNTVDTQYVYNNGVPGDTTGDPAKQPGGPISRGHALNGSLSDNSDIVVCFVKGTQIDTPNNQVSVEDLVVDDLVTTLSNGVQNIRWIGKSVRRVSSNLMPVRIKAGALGENSPTKDLLVSPAHRMLISGWRAELLFGEPEVLVPAKALVNDDTITVVRDMDTVEYFHIMFDKHEIVMSNGAPSESFHPNQDAIGTLDSEARAELLELFPELANADKNAYTNAVRPMLTDAEASLLR